RSAVPIRAAHSFPTRRSSDLSQRRGGNPKAHHKGTAPAYREQSLAPGAAAGCCLSARFLPRCPICPPPAWKGWSHPICITPLKRSEEHTSELQSRFDLVCRLL